MPKIVWEAPETPAHDFKEEGTDKLLARMTFRAGVTQGFINLASSLNMKEGGAAGVKATARLKTRIRMASAYAKMTGRTFDDSLVSLDIIEYTDETYPSYDVVVLMGVSPTKGAKKKFFQGRHIQIICLKSEVSQIQEEFYKDVKHTNFYNFDTKNNEAVDVTESNIT